jgi:3-hydroxyacyl-CoA dehydrogenase
MNPNRADSLLPFRSAAVLGAGVMGAQIAAHLANTGLAVELLDIAAPPGTGNQNVEALFARAAQLKPPPFFTADVAQRIRLGNFDDHWERVGEVDWVVEAVVENLAIKRSVLERLDGRVRGDAVVSTNTSGLPIHSLTAGRSASLRRRFLGTHFFNPPRYMKLLELVPTPDTDPAVVQRVAWFASLHLGKGVVVAKDTPNFIANRIGVHAILQAIRRMTEGGYSFEELDALTGPLIGRPKSATLRTCDVVGLDTLAHVAKNLHGAVPEDESRAAFEVPAVLQQLIAAGALGSKSKRGFYRKEGKAILSFDPATGQYAAPRPLQLGDLGALKKAGDLPARLRALYADGGRAGALFRAITLDTLAYSARRVPEITDSPADLDRAIRWGFGWELGPFETWDALGFERVPADLSAAKLALPRWIADVAAGEKRFYRERGAHREVFLPARGGYAVDPVPADHIDLKVLVKDRERTLWESDQAALLDLGDGVALFEFRSKANTLSAGVMEGLELCLSRIEREDFAGLVIGNGAEHFSPGANLVEMAAAAQQQRLHDIDRMIARFQGTVQHVCDAQKPVVLSTRGRVLGGACELLLACRHPVLAAESYVGLVELGAGLIPAGGGTMRMAAVAAARARTPAASDVQPWLAAAFETVAKATVSASAHEAIRLGYAPPTATIVRNADRHLWVAAQEVRRLAAEGWLPAPARRTVRVLGKPAREAFEAGLAKMREGGLIREYDEFLGKRLAFVITGGDLSAPADVPEQYLLDLEREVFVALLREKGTQERIAAIVGPKR